jgi:hypothetical protein
MKKAKNPAAVKLGRLGGKVKNPNKGFGSMTEKKRKAIASKGGKKKWANVRAKSKP